MFGVLGALALLNIIRENRLGLIAAFGAVAVSAKIPRQIANSGRGWPNWNDRDHVGNRDGRSIHSKSQIRSLPGNVSTFPGIHVRQPSHRNLHLVRLGKNWGE